MNHSKPSSSKVLKILKTSMREFIRNAYLSIFGSFAKPKKGIHIINSHFVSNAEVNIVKDKETFRSFLAFLSKRCVLLKIEDAVKMIEKNSIVDKCYVAFSFDDGFEECFSVIAPILEEYKCNAAFFVNSNYIQSSLEYQKEFNRRIKQYSKKPMNWNQVKELHFNGHLIGSHTRDHLNLAEISEKDVMEQILEDKKMIEYNLNCKCEYFAWPYGQEQHFSQSALKNALDSFKYIFSGTDYTNYFSFEGKVINRRHIEPFWKKSHLNYFLSVDKKR